MGWTAVLPYSLHKRWHHSDTPRTCPDRRSRVYRLVEGEEETGGSGPTLQNCCSESRWLQGQNKTLMMIEMDNKNFYVRLKTDWDVPAYPYYNPQFYIFRDKHEQCHQFHLIRSTHEPIRNVFKWNRDLLKCVNHSRWWVHRPLGALPHQTGYIVKINSYFGSDLERILLHYKSWLTVRLGNIWLISTLWFHVSDY